MSLKPRNAFYPIVCTQKRQWEAPTRETQETHIGKRRTRDWSLVAVVAVVASALALPTTYPRASMCAHTVEGMGRTNDSFNALKRRHVEDTLCTLAVLFDGDRVKSVRYRAWKTMREDYQPKTEITRHADQIVNHHFVLTLYWRCLSW